MRELIDKPIYNTASISHIHGWTTSYVRKGLRYRHLWNPSDLATVQKIKNQIVASYRDFIFLDILDFLIEQKLSPKKRMSILKKIASEDDLFQNRKLELATDGKEVFGKRPVGRKITDGVNLQINQIILPDLLEPILERRVFFGQENIFGWLIDRHFPDIIIHPAITFGKPHIKGYRIKSDLLFDIHTARNLPAKAIADEYEIENVGLVQQAIDFEKTRMQKQKVTLH